MVENLRLLFQLIANLIAQLLALIPLMSYLREWVVQRTVDYNPIKVSATPETYAAVPCELPWSTTVDKIYLVGVLTIVFLWSPINRIVFNRSSGRKLASYLLGSFYVCNHYG